MSKPQGDLDPGKSAGRVPTRRSRATPPPAAWVEARPTRETINSELGGLDARNGDNVRGDADAPPDSQPTGGADRPERDDTVIQDTDRHRADRAPPKDNAAEPDSRSGAQPAHESRAPAQGPGHTATRPLWVYALAAVAIIMLGGGGWYWFHRSNALRGGQPQAGQNGQQGAASGPQRTGGKIPVQVSEVQKVDLPVYLMGLGNVQAYNTVVVRTRVDGEVQAIGYQEGQIVQEGDLLVQIDPRPYKATLDQATAKQRQDEATLASNRLDLERTRQLAKNSYASQQQLDQQTANVGSLTAQIAIDQAAIENAQTQLGYTTIRAPISGRTGLRLVDRGNIVHASDTTGLVEITQIQPIAAIFTAPETQLPLISKAMKSGPVEVAALTSDGKSILDIGRLELLNNTVDTTSGTIRLKAVFPNGNDQLWPGQSVNTRLLQSTLRDALAVPAEAVQRGQDQLFTYVIGPDGKADKRTIEVSVFAEGLAVVTSGLLQGDKVVTSGQYRLMPGAQTEIRPSQGRDQDAGQGSGQKDRTADASGRGSPGQGGK